MHRSGSENFQIKEFSDIDERDDSKSKSSFGKGNVCEGESSAESGDGDEGKIENLMYQMEKMNLELKLLLEKKRFSDTGSMKKCRSFSNPRVSNCEDVSTDEDKLYVPKSISKVYGRQDRQKLGNTKFSDISDTGSGGETKDKGKVFRSKNRSSERDLKYEHVPVRKVISKEVSFKDSPVNQKFCLRSESENSDIERKSGHAPPKFYRSLERSMRKKQCCGRCSESSEGESKFGGKAARYVDSPSDRCVGNSPSGRSDAKAREISLRERHELSTTRHKYNGCREIGAQCKTDFESPSGRCDARDDYKGAYRVDKGGRDYFVPMSERSSVDRRPMSERSSYLKECDKSVPEMPKMNFPGSVEGSVDRDEEEYDLKQSLGAENRHKVFSVRDLHDVWRREFKVKGQIGKVGDKDNKLDYISVKHQIEVAQGKGYSDRDIIEGVINATTAGSNLRSLLQSMRDLTVERLVEILESYFLEMDDGDVMQQLESAHQSNTEDPQSFAIRILALKNRIVLESNESGLSERYVRRRMIKALDTGFWSENIQRRVSQVLGDDASDTNILRAVSLAVQSERVKKEKSVSGQKPTKVKFNLVDEEKGKSSKKGESESHSEQLLLKIQQLEAEMCELKAKENSGRRLEYGCEDCKRNGTGRSCNHCFRCGDTAHKRADCPIQQSSNLNRPLARDRQ